MEKINIRQLQDDVNLILFENFDIGIEGLKESNQICEAIGGMLNEVISLPDNFK